MSFSRCPKCGLLIAKDAVDCRSCGESASTDPAEVEVEPKPVSVGCIVGLVLVCAAAMVELYLVHFLDGAAWLALVVAILSLGALIGAGLSRADVSPRTRRIGGNLSTILGSLLLLIVAGLGLSLLLLVACALFIVRNFSSM
ncbi:MAG: hypothetical protein FD180_4720 [Planctomycetota bacterium]|nr:MAG: hypothetical protein FD180_4720 [Planctomycetota bacterium]